MGKYAFDLIMRAKGLNPSPTCPDRTSAIVLGEGRKKGRLPAPEPGLPPLWVAHLLSWFEIGPSVVRGVERELIGKLGPVLLRREEPGVFDRVCAC